MGSSSITAVSNVSIESIPNLAFAGCNSAKAQYSNTPLLHYSPCPDSRTRTAARLSSPKSCPTQLVVCRLQAPMASEGGGSKRPKPPTDNPQWEIESE